MQIDILVLQIKIMLIILIAIGLKICKTDTEL